jgi:NAD(P)-dependent dehydrogenase (short-subunit alcohol dehydrogenase family)
MTQRVVSRFGWHSTASDVLEEHNLDGQTVVVTGAASGIGYETAKALAIAGAEVVIGVRNPAAVGQAIDSLTDCHLHTQGT